MTNLDATPPRLEATGSRVPVWERLPDEPPEGPAQATQPKPPEFGVGPTPVAPLTPPSPTRQRSSGWLRTFVAAVLGAVLAVGGLQLIDGDSTPPGTDPDPEASLAASPVTEAPTQPSATLAPGEPAGDAATIGDTVIPSIVTVQVGTPTGEGLAIQGTGSGVVIGDRHIVTNEHVVSVASAFEVVLSDGRTTYDARLIGADPLTDVAVLEVDAGGLQPIALGETSALRVGDLAIAVGSPLGLEGGPSLTTGVLSAFGRQVRVSGAEPLYGMMQTDAPITEGSSGGALVDGQARLIGITTAVGVSSVGVEGIGFATPVELVMRVVDELVATGQVNHAVLGILGTTAFSTEDDGARIAAGVAIESVEPGSAAANAGVEPGDVIVAIDGEPVLTMEDLIENLRYHRGGDAVTVTIGGGSSERNLDLLLDTR